MLQVKLMAVFAPYLHTAEDHEQILEAITAFAKSDYIVLIMAHSLTKVYLQSFTVDGN